MVRIPVYTNDRELNTGDRYFKPTSDVTGPISQGLKDLGSGVKSFGIALQARQDKTARLDAERAVLDLDERTRATVRNEADNIPENGVGFHQRVMKGVIEDASRTLDTIPENLRAEFGNRIQRWATAQSEQVAGMEVAQHRNYVKNVTTRKIETLTDNVSKGFLTRETAIADADDFLTALQLPSERHAELRTALVRGIEASSLEHLRSKNPAEFFRQAQRYMPNGPSKSVAPGSTQAIAIEQAQAAGVDPRLLLMVGQIESSFDPKYLDPNRVTSKTIVGPFQMTRATRERYGIPENLRADPALQAAAMARIIKEAETRLEANGIEVTPGKLWGQHFLGAGGLIAFAKADPNTDAYELYKRVAGENIANQAFNGSNGKLLQRGMTVGQVLAQIDAKANSAYRSVGGYVTSNQSVNLEAPVEIMGEKFEQLRAGDLSGAYTKARETVSRITSAAFQRVDKDHVENPANINRHDPVFRKKSDEVAETDQAQAKLLRGDTEAFQKYVQLGQAGYLPRDAARAGLAMMDAPEVGTKIRGYELLASAYRSGDKTGLNYSGVPGEHSERIAMFVGLTTHGGFNPQDAIARVEQIRSPEFKLKESDLRSRLETTVRNRSWGEIESKIIPKQSWSDWIGLSSTGTGTRAVPDAIKRRFEERYQQYFRQHMLITNGDVETAKALALGDLEKSHNFTRVLGDKSYLMPYPPESYYPPASPLKPNESRGSLSKDRVKELYGYITTQALDAAREAAKRYKDPKGASLKPDDLQLIPTGQTRRDVEAGELPRYKLMYRGRDGWRDVTDEFRADPNNEYLKRDVGTAAQRGAQPAALDNAKNRFRAKRGE